VCWAGEEVGGIAPFVARELGQEVLAATKPGNNQDMGGALGSGHRWRGP
jgi:hypothetical protein